MNNKLLFILTIILLMSSFTLISEKKEPSKKPVSISIIPASYSNTYHWLEKSQLSNGLLESTENGNFVSLYDNALAALLFIEQGELARAEKIFNFFEARIDTELLKSTGGFFQFRDRDGNNGSRRWMGDNAWLLIALNHYHKATASTKYKHLSTHLEQWIRSLQDTDGGLWGGQQADGRQIHKITEGIITAFNAVPGYDDFHKNILSYLKQNRWNTADQLLVSWPTNKTYYYAMDLHSLGYGIFENFPKHVLNDADRYVTTQANTVTGEHLTGYGFDEDKDVIWFEGTAQMALAYQSAGLQTKSDVILENLDKAVMQSATDKQASGIPYASNLGSSYGKGSLWEHADTTPAISSTVWYLFAKMQFNPLMMGKEKHIPLEDQFWKIES